MRFFLLLTIPVLFCAAVVRAGERGPGGPEVLSSTISELGISKENYLYFLPGQNPDEAVAFFLKAVKKPKPFSTADSARMFLEDQVRLNNVVSIRCFFRQAGRVVRYVDLGTDGIVRLEANLKSGSEKELEILYYYGPGQVRMRSSLKYIDSLNLDSRKIVLPWERRNARFVHDGPEWRYHRNGRVRIELAFADGQRKDGIYTEWTEDGKQKAIYTIKDGQVLKPASSAARRSGRKAYLFGLDLYAAPGGEKGPSVFPNLGGAQNDVHLLREVLMRAHGFADSSIMLVGGDKATREFVLRSFQRFLSGLQEGDCIFLHFSGSGYLARVGEELRYYIPCRDVWRYNLNEIQEGSISQAELSAFLKTVQKKVGRRGQVILSLDACHSGAFLESSGSGIEPTAVQLTLRGESKNPLFNFIQSGDAPSAIFTATTKEGYGMEMNDKNGKTFGLYTYALARALEDPLIASLDELYQVVSDTVSSRIRTQVPGFLSRKKMDLFEPGSEAADESMSLPLLRATGNAYVLSVGISDYAQSGSKRLTFSNAASDAASYHRYFNAKFEELAGGDTSRHAMPVLLRNQQATKEEIVCYINEAISNTKPEDYFIFNFSGYCKQLTDSNGHGQTWFVPYGLKDISGDADIRSAGISLKQLKDLLQLVPANNQLFITEAGATPEFQKEFIQALIETSPMIATLSNKNRIFLVPKSSGADNCPCRGVQYPRGPLNHYITSLPPELNIYGLFTDSVYADAVRFALAKGEVDCGYFKTGYFDIFFEREFVKQMKLFLPEEVMQSRGIVVVEQEQKVIATAIKRRFALVVGTDNYQPNTPWRYLPNPVADARAIAASLSANFGFDTIVLANQPADSLYRRLLWLSQNLTASDQLLIYIGGHGDFDERLFDDGFVVTTDSRSPAADPYRNSYIQYSKLSRMINKLPSVQILTILDVCFGGSFDERVARNKSRSGNYEDLSTASFLQEKMKKRTRLYLTSGGKNEVPDGYAGRHSPFAVRLLEALETRGGKERMLTASALYQFVQKLPSRPLLGSFGDDEIGSEFILLGR